jgi:hypothetical protein
MPSLGNDLKFVVLAHRTRIDPYIWGMYPSLEYEKAYQQIDVINSMRIVVNHTGYAAYTTLRL